MNKVEIINAKSSRYVSEIPEFKNGFPKGVLNKKLADVGGTYFVMNCPYNYILISPSKNLVTSIAEDANNKYPILGIKGGVYESQIKEYINSNEIHKITVTWDSFQRLSDIMRDLNLNFKNYKIVVDEYHMIISNFGFRRNAISSMLHKLEQFDTYTFISATPINSKYEFEFLANLPHYEIHWENTSEVNIHRISTSRPIVRCSEIIELHKNGDLIIGDERPEELAIFLNSVQGIKTILERTNLKPEQVKILVGDDVKNQESLDMTATGGYKFSIDSVNNPNKPYTFITSTGFQGINLFSNSCYNIIVSDRNKKHTFIDPSRDLTQIAGRFRSNSKYNNVFRNQMCHIYSLNAGGEDLHRLKEAEIKELRDVTLDAIKVYEDKADDVKAQKSLLKTYAYAEEHLFFTIEDEELRYSDLKECFLREANDLQNYTYTNNVRVANAYKEAGVSSTLAIDPFKALEPPLKIRKDSIKAVYEAYQEGVHLDWLKVEFPYITDLVKYIPFHTLEGLRWQTVKIMPLLAWERNKYQIFNKIKKQAVNNLITAVELRDFFKKEFEERGIDMLPKASLIEESKLYSVKKKTFRVDGKSVGGYEII